MASLHKRGELWYVRVSYGKVVKDIPAKTRDRRVAESLAKRLELEKRTNGYKLPTKTPLVPALESFMAWSETIRRPRCYWNEVSRLRQVFGSICPRLRKNARGIESITPITELGQCRFVEQITPMMIMSHLDSRAAHIKGKSVNADRGILQQFFRHCIQKLGMVHPHGGKTGSPVDEVPKARVKLSPIRYLSTDQIELQLQILEGKPVLRAAVAIMLFAGLRREEATWLTADDLDKPLQWLWIRPKSDPRTGEMWAPKINKPRRIPISPTLKTILSEYMLAGRPKFWLIPSPKGLRWNPENMAAAIKAESERFGLAWNCLDYRHTFGTHLVQMGYSGREIAEWMGNSEQIVHRHYANIEGRNRKTDVDFYAKHKRTG